MKWIEITIAALLIIAAGLYLYKTVK